jgi:hypothetical protein
MKHIPQVMQSHCLIAFNKVRRPKELGGVCISNIQNLYWALRVRWLWLRKIESDKPWFSFPVQSNSYVYNPFSVAVATEIGDGATTLVWKDQSLQVHNLKELVPTLYNMVPKWIANKRSVLEALDNQRWLLDILGIVTWTVTEEFHRLGELLSDIRRQCHIRFLWQNRLLPFAYTQLIQMATSCVEIKIRVRVYNVITI